jgi:hypothetical protein
MMKKFAKIVCSVFTVFTLMVAVACNTEVLPTGNLVSQGGAPGGGTLEGGGGSASMPAFDIDNLPSPKFWNDNGHMEDWPDLFRFANGKRVQNVAEWPARAAEIAKILQFYKYGFYPDSSKSKLTVSHVDPPGAGTTAQSFIVPITVTANGVTRVFNAPCRLPAEAITPAGAGKKYPVLIQIGSGTNVTGWSYLANDTYKWAMIIMPAGDMMGENAAHSGIVTDLYGYNADKDLDACGVYMAHAWGVARVMDAIERGGFGGKIDVNKVVTTGMSRWGHSSYLAGAFSQTQDTGTRPAVTDIGDGGNGPDRFLSMLGVTSEWTNVSQAPGKTYYLKAIPDPNPFVAGVNPYPSVKAVWTTAGYNMTKSTSYDRTTGISSGDGDYDYAINFWEWMAEYGDGWHGIGSGSSARNETPSWFANRYQQFADLHDGMGLDHVTVLPDRYPRGYLCTTPFETEEVISLIAPRGILPHGGHKSGRVKPEGVFANFLVVDELYKFLDAEYANGIKIYYIPHAQPDYEVRDMWEFGEAMWSSDPRANMPAKFREHPYPIMDPRSKVDYSKIKWARPGATETIADLVKDVDDSGIWGPINLPHPDFNIGNGQGDGASVSW